MDKTSLRAQQWESVFLAAMIVAGILMRLLWTSDMEWKDDEKDMHAMALKAAQTGSLPDAGMRSGGGPVNPGLSVAPFALFAKISADPVVMNRCVQVTSVVALICFLFFVMYKIPPGEKQVWMRGMALAAVSPLAVLFSRKIWAQDMLPIISFGVIFFHFNRSKGWAAFLWGLTGALIGQIHMSGFFFAGGLFAFTVYHDRLKGFKFKWGYWLTGSALGSITLITWLLYLSSHPQISRQNIWHIFQFNFFFHWFIDSQGINIYYSLREEFWRFIREPLIAGSPTFMVLLAHLVLVAGSVYTLIWMWKTGRAFIFRMNHQGIAQIVKQADHIKFYLYSLLLGLGVLLTLSAVLIHPHYLICAFPFQYIFVAIVLKNRNKLWYAVVTAQLVVSFCFLLYIHRNGGAPQGDYGTSYRIQMVQGN